MRHPIIAVTLSMAAVVSTGAQTRGPIFNFRTDDLLLNVHHFLYVLGRHEAAIPDRTRRATVNAPADAEKGLALLTTDEQKIWRDAVTVYAQGPSKQDMVFDRELSRTTQALARVGNVAALERANIDPPVAAALERATPLYEKAWWAQHRKANDGWVAALQPLLDRHGRAVLDVITRAYGMRWPSEGYPVHVSGYTNWAGAYSTRGNFLIIASLDPGNTGLNGLEITFHEAMHQWDNDIYEVLSREARKQNLAVPDLLSHALIFYTAGEAVRSVAPEHVPYAESNGLWRQKGLGAFKPAFDEIWKPYLTGNGERDKALADVLARTIGRP